VPLIALTPPPPLLSFPATPSRSRLVDLWTTAAVADLVARVVSGILVGAAAVVAGTHWAVRRGHLKPFGGWSTGIRRLSDPALRPVEARLVRWGRNPQEATLWLLGGSLVAGLLLITLTRWLIGFVARLSVAARSGPMVWVALLVSWTFDLLILALIVRVIGSWVGLGPYSRVGRIAWRLTEWLLGPIRRILPPMGMLDLSPIVAYFVLMVVRSLVLSVL